MLRLYREAQGIVDVPIPPPTPDPSIEFVLPTNTGVSASLAQQISEATNRPIPERLPEKPEVREKEFVEAPQRLFWRRKNPPNYDCPEYMSWWEQNSTTLGDRMLPEDIAFLLTQGAFHYENYENLKHLGPRQVFQTAAISLDNPSWKRGGDWLDERDPLDVHSQTVTRAQEAGTSAVGIGEDGILTWEKSDSIQVEALPDVIRMHDFNKGKRAELVAEREKLKDKLWQLSPKNKKSMNLLTGVPRKSQQQKCRRRIQDIDKELKALARDWRKVRMEGTGRPSFTVEIPPCPQGSKVLSYLSAGDRGQRLMTRQKFRQYMAQAFGAEAKDSPDRWNRCTPGLENAILRHAKARGLLNDWILESAAPQDQAWLREVDFEALFEEIQDEDAGAENAQKGYRKGEFGQLPDNTIRRVAPKGRPPDGEGTSGREKD